MIIMATIGGDSTPAITEEPSIFGKVFRHSFYKETFLSFNFEDPSHRVSGGFEGLVIVTAMSFTLSVYWACRFISQLELDLK
jgi:hypothetical protein